MKRCSTCNRTYDDPILVYCVDDGTPLKTVDEEDDTTVVRPRNAEDGDWNAVAYQPPGSYAAPGSDGVKRRRVWPWVLGIVGAFLLGILALSIAAVILVPRMTRSVRDQQASSNTNQVENANTAIESNSNSNTNEPVETPPPTDHEQALAQLTNLEHEWTVANINADKKQLDRILADDFVGQGEQDQLLSKADYIRTIERDTTIDKWEFSNLKLSLVGNRATLTGIFTYYFVNAPTVSYDFTDKFVWREGRWQATGAELKRRGTPEVDL
jgi:type II secretory pathway pseudopilin PulG